MSKLYFSKGNYVQGYNGPGNLFFYPSEIDIHIYKPNPITDPEQKIINFGSCYSFNKEQTIALIDKLNKLVKEF